MPVMPPSVKVNKKAMAKSIAVVNQICPRHIVAIQLNTLIPVGMAMTKLVIANADEATGPRPVVNMWWLHTAKPIKPIKIPAKTTIG